MSGTPQYIWTEQDGIGYALIDSEYVDGCIVTADPNVANQFSHLAWTPSSQGAPWKLDRKLFNAKCAAALALWRAHAYKGGGASVDVEAIADAVVEKLNDTIATDADLAAMRLDILEAIQAIPDAALDRAAERLAPQPS